MPRHTLKTVLFAGALTAAGCAPVRTNSAAPVPSEAVARFVGAWRMDSTKMTSVGGGTGSGRGGGGGTGGGIGMGPAPDMLVVRQGTNTITFDQIRGDTHARLTLLLDGAKMANTIGSGDAARQGVYITTFTDGRLVSTITAPAAKGSTTKVTYSDVRYIDDSGALVVEISIPGRPNSRRVVYTKSR